MTSTIKSLWYCVRSQPKHEHIAAASLRLLPGVEVFNPQIRIRRTTARGPVHFTESVFPGYLFACFELSTSLMKVRHARGVATVVHFADHIPSVPANVIEELRRQLHTNAETVFVEEPIQGDRVAVCNGPFRGYEGLVTRVLPAKQRVQVLLDLMGRATTTELNFNAILLERNSPAAMVPALARGE